MQLTLCDLSDTVLQMEVSSYLTTPCLQRDVKNDVGVETDGKKQSKRGWVISKRKDSSENFYIFSLSGQFSTASLLSTFHPQRALSAAGEASHPSLVSCWSIRP